MSRTGAEIGHDKEGIPIQGALRPHSAVAQVALSDSSAASAEIDVSYISIYSDVDVFLQFGKTALTALETAPGLVNVTNKYCLFLPANQIEYIYLGDDAERLKFVSGILDTGTGTLTINLFQ